MQQVIDIHEHNRSAWNDESKSGKNPWCEPVDESVIADAAMVNGQFNLIFHPISNVFVKDVCSVWQECYRVLETSGRLLSGFMNPDYLAGLNIYAQDTHTATHV